MAKYTIKQFPIEKKMVADGAYFNKHVKLMNLLFELDITLLRKKITTFNKENKKKISLLACLLWCYAKALEKHPQCISMKSWDEKLFQFEEVDIFFPFDAKLKKGGTMLWSKIMKSVNKKSILEIEDEIKGLAHFEKDISREEKIFFSLPFFLRRIYYAYMLGTPPVRNYFGGNAYFSSGMHHSCNMATFGFPSHFHSSGMFLGLFEIKNEANGEEKCLLPINLSLDHVIGDGAMLFRLLKSFKHFTETLDYNHLQE